MLLLPQPLAAILAFCDGTRTAPAVAADFSQHFGVDLSAGIVEQLIDAVDEVCLLDNARARAAQQKALDLYRSAPSRPPLLAGQGYPADPGELHQWFEELLDAARVLHGANSYTAESTLGLLSPHIDYARGGHVYAQVWERAAAAAQEADLVILIGTDHYGTDPFTLTRQSYATPYGLLPTAQNVVAALVDVIGEESAFAGELRHRGEHSLELVAVWLHHMRRGKPCELVPILVGSFHRYLHTGDSPAADPELARILDALRRSTAGRRVLVVASGDLAHVGPAFGGKALDAAARAQVHADDEALIEAMRTGDAEGFFASIHHVEDRNNVCGVVPIYLTLRLLGAVRGQQAGYASCSADDHNSSAVTVAGMLFHP
jgi:AmmeMemoRadiSam system protein B